MHTLKTLAFAEHFVEPVYALEKEITLRHYRREAHEFTEGEIVIGTFGERGIALLRITEDTETTAMSLIPDSVAQESGFEDMSDAFKGLGSYYNDLTLRSSIAIIRFEICEMPGHGNPFYINF